VEAATASVEEEVEEEVAAADAVAAERRRLQEADAAVGDRAPIRTFLLPGPPICSRFNR